MQKFPAVTPTLPGTGKPELLIHRERKDFPFPNIQNSNYTVDALSLSYLTPLEFFGFYTGRVYRDKGHGSPEQQSGPGGGQLPQPTGPSDFVICRFKVTKAGAGISSLDPSPGKFGSKPGCALASETCVGGQNSTGSVTCYVCPN